MLQLTLYGMWICEKWPVDQVRMSLIYIRTKGKPATQPVTIVATRSELEHRMLSLASTIERMREVAALPDAVKLKCTCSWRQKCPPQKPAPKAALLERMNAAMPDNNLKLYIDIVPIKETDAYTFLDDIIAERAAAICEEKGVTNLLLIDFGKGAGHLSTNLLNNPPPLHFYTYTHT